jgi:hypothetical protein
MPAYDRLPAAVRRRLAASAFNLCAACVDIEVREATPRPALANYFTVIERIERELRRTERR